MGFFLWNGVCQAHIDIEPQVLCIFSSLSLELCPLLSLLLPPVSPLFLFSSPSFIKSQPKCHNCRRLSCASQFGYFHRSPVMAMFAIGSYSSTLSGSWTLESCPPCSPLYVKFCMVLGTKQLMNSHLLCNLVNELMKEGVC